MIPKEYYNSSVPKDYYDTPASYDEDGTKPKVKTDWLSVFLVSVIAAGFLILMIAEVVQFGRNHGFW